MTKESMKRAVQLCSLLEEGSYKLDRVEGLQDRLNTGASCGRLAIGAVDVTIENPALLKCLVDITSVAFKVQIAKLEKELEAL